MPLRLSPVKAAPACHCHLPEADMSCIHVHMGVFVFVQCLCLCCCWLNILSYHLVLTAWCVMARTNADFLRGTEASMLFNQYDAIMTGLGNDPDSP